MGSVKSLPLWNEKKSTGTGAEDDFQPFLELYPIKTDNPRGAVIVCPGGGYAGRADHEGGPIAETFNKLGFHAFVLQYRVSPYRHPAPLYDAARAVRMVRANASEWDIIPDKIAVLGFSAGGHLTGSIGVHYPDVPEDSEYPGISCRPDAIVPCYAVLNDHQGSFENLFGDNADETSREYFSLDRYIDSGTPPAFLWHTVEDPVVPVENAFDFCAALRKYEVPFELHVFPYGRHGLGLGQEQDEVKVWPELCGTWLRKMGWRR